MVLLNGQWQGGYDKITLDGMNEIKKEYLEQVPYEEVCINEEDNLSNENVISSRF